uniref:DUF4116 domain-containing protein n=1 Tax=Zooxanthella nutricula TaxID=1333877 RepID=A0A7S2VRZ7_9DINO
MGGQVLVGPVALAGQGLVRELRSRELALRRRALRPVRARLFLDGREVEDSQVFEGPGPLSFLVVFHEFEPLGHKERARYMRTAPNARRTPTAFDELPEAAKADEALALEYIAWHAESFRYTNEVLRYDPNFQASATKRNWRVLRYADDVVVNDADIVRRCVATDGLSLRLAGGALAADKELVLMAVASESAAIEFAAEALRGDRDVVLAAVRDNGHNLRHAAPSAKLDRELVLAAVRTDPAAVQHAAGPLRGDLGVALEAARSPRFTASLLLPLLQGLDASLLSDEAFLAGLRDVVPPADLESAWQAYWRTAGLGDCAGQGYWQTSRLGGVPGAGASVDDQPAPQKPGFQSFGGVRASWADTSDEDDEDDEDDETKYADDVGEVGSSLRSWADVDEDE